ncbi:MAG: hypothetical protein EPO26_17800 [Chloroflexota bacterium]|nr:MAG: hypothetical protein EPO26_17800 [Chloroflexota bacterium]
MSVPDWQRDPDLGRLAGLARLTPREATCLLLDEPWWERISRRISPVAQGELRELIRRRALVDRPGRHDPSRGTPRAESG